MQKVFSYTIFAGVNSSWRKADMSKLTEVDVHHLHAAAERVLRLLDSLQTRFRALANTESCATDQTLVATHAFSHAELVYLVGTLPQDEDVRAAFELLGLLPVIGPHLRALATTVRPSLYIPEKKAMQIAGDSGNTPAAAA
jgi:hypothetical protein